MCDPALLAQVLTEAGLVTSFDYDLACEEATHCVASTRSRCSALRLLVRVLACLCRSKEDDNLQKPMAGPRATALRVTWLYVAPSLARRKSIRVQIGREMVVAEKSGDWMRVFANTDIEEEHADGHARSSDDDESPPPISGWMQAKGVVMETTPNGDQILMGAAANQEALASDPRGPVNAAQSARLLYRRLVEMFPNSPLAAEAAWRAADIHWQIQKADAQLRGRPRKSSEPICASRWMRTA